MPAHYDKEINSRLQSIDGVEASNFVHRDELRIHRDKRLITEVYPHPIRKNSRSGKHTTVPL